LTRSPKKIACGAGLLRFCEASAIIAEELFVCQIFARKAGLEIDGAVVAAAGWVGYSTDAGGQAKR